MTDRQSRGRRGPTATVSGTLRQSFGPCRSSPAQASHGSPATGRGQALAQFLRASRAAGGFLSPARACAAWLSTDVLRSGSSRREEPAGSGTDPT